MKNWLMQMGVRRHYRRERENLLRRFLDIGEDGLSDHELLELVLTIENHGADARTLAGNLLDKFGSFAKIIHAEEYDLRAVKGMDSVLISKLKLQRLTLRRTLKTEIGNTPVIQSLVTFIEYLQQTMGYSKVEEFRVAFLNHRHALIADEVMQRGTVNHTPMYPREIIKRALELSASAIILFHNHPSGDPTPSRNDIELTNQIIAAAQTVNIAVHDHFILTETGHYSFKQFWVFDVPMSPRKPEMPAETNDQASPPQDDIPIMPRMEPTTPENHTFHSTPSEAMDLPLHEAADVSNEAAPEPNANKRYV